ncbi:MAG: tetratricopeptide repeat protein [Hamadaea sp.]|uniref:tetratricopeptide repeat protein n=1 Tax=Hamadaea sp. TaxID=2024425 RepID=UPI001826ABE7|nr:tetratricopeptide repeat protein [Hamadaea sp.]NUR71229.1 tetratricopeptide repeat protein [Hamadaea sp.]NUT17760.1 tetratricopeptide repeat protein [Hamadaea sp.]
MSTTAIARAAELAGRRAYAEAVVVLRAHLAIEPADALAWRRLAVVLRFEGDVTAATEAAHQAIHLEPESADAHATLASTLLHGGQTEGAVASARAALRLRPNDPDVLTLLELALAQRPEDPAYKVAKEAVLAVDAHRRGEAVLRVHLRSVIAARWITGIADMAMIAGVVIAVVGRITDTSSTFQWPGWLLVFGGVLLTIVGRRLRHRLSPIRKRPTKAGMAALALGAGLLTTMWLELADVTLAGAATTGGIVAFVGLFVHVIRPWALHR